MYSISLSHSLAIYLSLYISLSLYIYIYILSSSRKPSGRSFMVSVVDSIQRFLLLFLMVSVVVFLFYGFCRRRKRFSFCLWLPSLVFVYGFRRGRKTCFYGFRRRIFGGSKTSERIERFLVFCVFSTGFRRWFLMVSVKLFYGFRYVCLWIPSSDFWWILPPQENPKFYNAIPRCFVFLVLVSVVGFLWFPSWQENILYGFRRRLFNGFCRGKERFLIVSVVFSLFVNGFPLLLDRGFLSDGNRNTKEISGRFRDELSVACNAVKEAPDFRLPLVKHRGDNRDRTIQAPCFWRRKPLFYSIPRAKNLNNKQ